MRVPEPDTRALRAMFGRPVLPRVSLRLDDIAVEAQKAAGALSISGVQPKLSVALSGDQLVPVARNGRFILKPQTQGFPELPQNEFLCMDMARHFGLRTPPFLLLELADKSPAYLVRRFDRLKQGRRVLKLACEDMQQVLGGRDKYAGSHERIGQAVRDHCTFSPLELQRLFELTIFNFAIGNADAHLKNVSLLTGEDGTVSLSPVYDLVSSRLVMADEADELALTVGGKRSRLRRDDFLALAQQLGVAPEYAASKIEELNGLRETFSRMIDASALSTDMRSRFRTIVAERLSRLWPPAPG
jgi:serine/threonine-protein kinase HipA